MGLSEGLTNIQNGLGNISKPALIGTIGAVAGAGLVAGAVALNKRKKTYKSQRSKSRGISRDRKFISKQKWEQRYKRKTPGKRYKTKKTRKSGIHYTKNGQPYIILSSGKARFIKRKGGKK